MPIKKLTRKALDQAAQQLKKTAKAADLNKDKKITKQELSQAVQKSGFSGAKKIAAHLIEGESATVAEINQSLKSLYDNIIDQDDNNDGQLTATELSGASSSALETFGPVVSFSALQAAVKETVELNDYGYDARLKTFDAKKKPDDVLLETFAPKEPELPLSGEIDGLSLEELKRDFLAPAIKGSKALAAFTKVLKEQSVSLTEELEGKKPKALRNFKALSSLVSEHFSTDNFKSVEYHRVRDDAEIDVWALVGRTHDGQFVTVTLAKNPF